MLHHTSTPPEESFDDIRTPNVVCDSNLTAPDSPTAGPSALRTTPKQSNSRKTKRDKLVGKDVSECTRVLRQVFGHSGFKGKQKEIVEAAYEGKDVLVVAPTGMGKSLCFQIPAIADKRGLSIIVSPLLALMQNQIENLRHKDIEVASLSSQIKYREQQEISGQLQDYNTTIKLLYITPERLFQPDFMSLLRTIHENNNFNRLVVDEAHCISEWGHDFRAVYRKIGIIRQRYPDVPIMALTATATDAVRRDIIESLGLDERRLFMALHPFNRPNLFYEVRYLSNPQPHNQMSDIFDYITTLHNRRGRASAGLVYCRLRKTCDELSAFLRAKGLNARPYHRGIPDGTLEKTLKGWTSCEPGEPGSVDLVIATIAFGMGIDKGDVRYIIHYDLPKSLEGYYQETGRAGRDGDPAKCILYYSREDSINVRQFVPKDDLGQRHAPNNESPTHTQRASRSIQTLIKLAEDINTCRHVSICRYFGETIDEKDPETLKSYCDRMCDVCKYPEKTKARITKLSSREEAAVNTYQRPKNNGVNQAQGSTKPEEHGTTSWSGPEAKHFPSKGSYGAAQKRPGTEYPEILAKKTKVTPAPALLVTKPFASASSLSKPFKAPTLARPQNQIGTKVAPLPPAQPSTLAPKPRIEPSRTKAPSPTPKPAHLDLDGDIPDNISMEDGEISPELDLPVVGLFWDPEHSGKVSVGDRRKQFQSLRRSLHRVLIEPVNSCFYWEKVSPKELDDDERIEVLFNTATELELSAICLSSTLDGYTCRVASIKDDIKSLMRAEVWDSKDGDFEDAQDVIASLRRCSMSVSKGNKRA